VLLYELLTGTTPFDAKELLSKGYAEMQRIIVEREPLKPSTRLSTMKDEHRTIVASNRRMEGLALGQMLRGDLDWIVMKCLEKDRQRRYETASGLAADLRRHLDDAVITARPPSTAYLLQKLIKRNKLAVLSGGVVASAIILALAVLILTTIRVTQERNRKDLALQAESAATELATQRATEASKQLFLALQNQAQAHRYSRRVGQRADSLAALTQAAQLSRDEQLRDDAIAALALPDIRRGRSSEQWVSDSRIHAFDDHYQRYARFEENGDIVVCAIVDDHEIQRIPSGLISRNWPLTLSPDGEFVAKLEDGGRVRVWRVADGQPALREAMEGCGGLAFSHDSRQLALSQNDLIRLFELSTGREINRWSVPATPNRLAFDLQDQRIAVGYVRKDVVSIHHAASGKLLADLPVGTTRSQVLAWHPDGEHLAVGGSDPRIQIWDVSAKRQIASLEGHAQQVTDLSFDPQSDLLASYAWDGVLRLWEPWSGRQMLQTATRAMIRFSGDGRWLGSVWDGDRRHHLLEIARSSEYRSLPSGLALGQIGLHEGDLSPDGQWLACATLAGVQIREFPGGRVATTLPTDYSYSALFEPDGGGLFTASVAGLKHWPVERSVAGQIRIGPPRSVSLPFEVPMRISLTGDGRTLAVVGEQAGKATLLDPASDLPPRVTVDHPSAGFVALSRGGHRLATAGWHGDSVRLWDAHTGAMLHEWKTPPHSRVFFTPDARELVIARGDSFDFWSVETFQLNRRLPREGSLFGDFAAFSPDGNLMALPMAPGVVEIKTVNTARTVARLEDPFGDRSGWMAFSVGNRELIVVAPYVSAVHIWDLDTIRRRLEAMGLWSDWPGFPTLVGREAGHRQASSPAARIEVVGTNLTTNRADQSTATGENR
jgi:eukaryotic-like serine/threonine-protein kinase